ncbi:Pentalenene oxygenase [Planctomycetes bacterium Poly30]|uniref:Pentalenene oxygenase n=1 Tax=Saltatorellus ferox TaxID=2528018 RepID=A0A518EPU6_9BACT|nr:Pentalenene oxygenase [Planctomycetes bacterium Poly30]
MQDPATLPGPSEPFAFDANAATLKFLREGCATYGDVWAIPPTGGADSATGGGGRPIWVLNDPEAIHHVLTKRQADYGKGVGFERVKMLLGDGLIVSDGEHWKQRRRMLQPAFSRPSVGGMRGLVDECIARRAHLWEECAESGEPLDVSDEANRLGLRIILRAIFGDDLAALDERDGGNPFNLVVDTHERDLMFAMRFRQLWPVVREMIERRRSSAGASGPPRDFLGLYMGARDRETDAALDMDGLVDELMTLLIAGHETTAATLAWAWSLLARHPEVQDQVRAEVRAGATSEEGREPVPGTGGSHLVQRVVHETLRLYPPVWMFTRRALKDDVLAGRPIPAGTQILLSPFLLHRHPRYWASPETFDPSRFSVAGAPEHRSAYIPFSSGPRRCAGDVFALNTAVQEISWGVSRYHLTAPDPEPPELDPGVNLRPLQPIRLFVHHAR